MLKMGPSQPYLDTYLIDLDFSQFIITPFTRLERLNIINSAQQTWVENGFVDPFCHLRLKTETPQVEKETYHNVNESSWMKQGSIMMLQYAKQEMRNLHSISLNTIKITKKMIKL